ncbi:MAG: hypothetical protein IPK13_04340 [Deltaproteobacteria bacterium]|nr:hypothetical protein [Deltaproteobacteria bacterium]
MRSSVFVPVAALCAASLAGCGSSASKEEAVAAWGATQVALAKAASAAAQSSGLSATERPLTVSASNVSCGGGGTLGVTGSYETGGTGSYSFDLGVTFDGCVETGLTMTGDINYATDYQLGSNYTLSSATITMTGSVDYSGQIDASCDFDVTISGNATSWSISGSICGIDVKEAGISYYGG